MSAPTSLRDARQAVQRVICEADLSARQLQQRVAQMCEGYHDMSQLAAIAPLPPSDPLLETATLPAWREFRPDWLPPLPAFGFNGIHAELAECNQVRSEIDCALSNLSANSLSSSNKGAQLKRRGLAGGPFTSLWDDEEIGSPVPMLPVPILATGVHFHCIVSKRTYASCMFFLWQCWALLARSNSACP